MRRAEKLARVLLASDFRRALVHHQVAAAVEHSQVLRTLNCRTVVDIGANRGQFALVARHSFPAASILSFEPLPRPAQRFRDVLSGHSRVVLHEVALGSQNGTAMIHVSGHDDSSSLLPIGALQTALFPGTGEVRTQAIQVGRLSEFVDGESISPPALLKLDVQGYEIEVLKGCEELIGLFLYVYVECSFVELYDDQPLAGDVAAWLSDHGFLLRGVHNVAYDGKGQAIQGDFLFIKVGNGRMQTA